ncbi:DnaJ-class molecular chaperone CbpA [hydrothermal vent metagenome]|uniref:DnaJ-class molecular chaperone CbpA n=1 Tax=hydrothermal vent metagenome TaxID=652676 RepID=A0A3B1E4H7_9ZZZZ
MAKSLYETLEIGDNATSTEIKKAYRKLAKKYHPDINKTPQAEEKFKEINAAYEVLSNDEKKSQYDTHGDNMFGGQNFHDFASNQGAGVDINDILSQMFGGRGGFQGGFGGGFREPDLDIEASLSIDFETSILGGIKNISINAENFDIKIPEGIKDGQKIRAKGKGRKAQGFPRGDLIITLQVDESDKYDRENDDLIMNFDISLHQALFGGKVEIKTLYKTLSLKIPKNTKQNQKFRVKDLGALNRKTKQRGFLYLKANIILPKIDTLDKEFVKILDDKLPK